MKLNDFPHNPRVKWCYLEREHIKEFFGDDSLQFTVRGLAFYYDGKLTGIGGVQMINGYLHAFSKIHKDANVSKITIWRCAKMVMDMVDKRKLPVCAIPDKEHETAKDFLERLGFNAITFCSEGLFYERIT